MDIKRLIVSDAVSNRVSFGRGNPKNYLTIHQTGNTAAGANAKAHHNLQARSGIGYGWHWQVDDHEAIQTHDHDFKIWHAGDNRGKGNTESISIEICVNLDGDYNQSVENGAKLAAMILKEENIDISRMVQHNYWTGKNCPEQIRACKNGICWSHFVEKVRGYLNGSNEPIGWIKDNVGWWYRLPNGDYAKSSWSKINDEWYYFGADGYAYCEKWLKYKGEWYYFDKDCKMLCEEWLTIGEETFYFNDWGVCDLNYVRTIGGKQYAFNERGALIKNKIIEENGSIENIKK
ncbi:MAG: N-acetylmuramoyl-L-alanine amidase [Parvimonas sp.]|nr:N-acetylmuramoyl-L-alanine amidase [Parvimonas sp.]